MRNEILSLEEKLKSSEYSEDEISLIIDGLMKDKITTFRVNPLKCKDKTKLLKNFENLEIKVTEYKSIINAYILNNYYQKDGFDSKTGLNIEKFSMYENGEIYVQSLSSMIPVLALNLCSGENVLDMCAAPGSKTTMIQSLTNNKINLTAVELHKDRYEKLLYNLDKQGAYALTFNMNAIDLNDMLKFDKILLDAPCSGSGILNLKTNKYKEFFNNELISKCVKTQKRLIKKAYKLLKSGGCLIYSTCSILKEENEDIVDFALDNGFKIDFYNLKNKLTNLSQCSSVNEGVYIKIFPNELWEGFFVAKLIKSP